MQPKKFGTDPTLDSISRKPSRWSFQKGLVPTGQFHFTPPGGKGHPPPIFSGQRPQTSLPPQGGLDGRKRGGTISNLCDPPAKHFCTGPHPVVTWVGEPPMGSHSPSVELLGHLPQGSSGAGCVALQAPGPLVGSETQDADWGFPANSTPSWVVPRCLGQSSAGPIFASGNLLASGPVPLISSGPAGTLDAQPPASKYPSWIEVHTAIYRDKGASPLECQLILDRFAKATIQRFSTAWMAFWSFIHSTVGFHASRWELLDVPTFVTKLRSLPLWQLALWLDSFLHSYSAAQARNVYASFLALPYFEQLRYENLLKAAKRTWNASKPKYDHYFSVETILKAFCTEEPPEREEDIRLRCILLLRLLCLFRGVDLERAHRNIDCAQQPWMLESKRKGRAYWARYPVPCIWPENVNPQVWLDQYLHCTADYTGPSLFVSLPTPQGRKPIQSDTINGLTTRFLQSIGITQWTAHATRGAGATALIARGVEPAIVQSLGDWQSTDCFNKFYNRVRATKPFQQCLLPEHDMGPEGPVYEPCSSGVLARISKSLRQTKPDAKTRSKKQASTIKPRLSLKAKVVGSAQTQVVHGLPLSIQYLGKCLEGLSLLELLRP